MIVARSQSSTRTLQSEGSPGLHRGLPGPLALLPSWAPSSVKTRMCGKFYFMMMLVSRQMILIIHKHTLSVCYGCHHWGYHSWVGGLKQQKCIFLKFWRLQVQGQGAGRVGFL